MGASNRRRPLGDRLRATALPMTACVFVLASSADVDKSPHRPPPEPPLYQKSADAEPLTPEERRSCPSVILIATGSDPFYLLTSAAEGVHFDVDADGKADRLSWTRPDTSVAFLAIDQNGDGAITSGKEMVGSHTWPGAPHGFRALGAMARDTNGGILRGSVSSDDPLLERLLLWTDSNHNAISEPRELRPAGELFSEIGLGYRPEHGRDSFGNNFLFEGWAHLRTAPGRNQAASAEADTQRRRRLYAICFVRLSS